MNQKYKALIKVNVKNNINNIIIKMCMIVCVCFPSKEHTVNTFIFVKDYRMDGKRHENRLLKRQVL